MLEALGFADHQNVLEMNLLGVGLGWRSGLAAGWPYVRLDWRAMRVQARIRRVRPMRKAKSSLTGWTTLEAVVFSYRAEKFAESAVKSTNFATEKVYRAGAGGGKRDGSEADRLETGGKTPTLRRRENKVARMGPVSSAVGGLAECYIRDQSVTRPGAGPSS